MGANHMMDFERKKFNFRTSSFSSLESVSLPSYPSFSPFMGFTPKYMLNPYLLHFGNIQERHLWKKNPIFIFLSLMTSYIADYL